MKKSFLLIIIILILLSSCRTKESYQFLNTTDSIVEIAVVEVSFDSDGTLIETKIKVINEIDAFLETFNNVSCYKYYGDPLGATQEGINDIVIKISYISGDYELINWNGQSKYTNEKGFVYYAGYSVFDEAQFEALVEKNVDGTMS